MGARVAIAFVPGPPPRAKPPLISRMESPGRLAIGFASSVLGTYSPEQALLDMSAGGRTWTSLYGDELPEQLDVALDGTSGKIPGWNAVRGRAETPPAEIVPGLLAGTVVGDGRRVAYVGLAGRLNREAIVAADLHGQIDAVALRRRSAVAAEVGRSWARADLLVARLPAGRDGSRALRALLSGRRRQDLVLVVQQPTRIARRLIAVGAAGLGGDGSNLRSGTTRTDGLVSATDFAPTALEHLDLPTPDEVDGQPIEAAGSRTASDLTDMKNRLAEIGPRRWTVLVAGLAGVALLVGVTGVRSRAFARAAGRGALLAALWFPSILLVTGALAPSRSLEALAIAISGSLLSIATLALLPWPRALALPAAIAIGAHVGDLALGSTLTQLSLLGPNPILGARFYGVGNELEVTLGVVGLLGTGACLAHGSGRALAWAFLVSGGAIAFALAWGKLGSDVGASLMIAAGATAAALAALGGRLGAWRVAIVLAAPVAALAALALLDLSTGGDAHFSRSVLRAGGLSELADVAQRRVELSYRSLGRGVIPLLVVLAIVALVLGVRYRARLLAPVARAPGLQAGAVGALVAVVVGALSNDSGPMILLIGTSYLALAAGYFSAHGESDVNRQRGGHTG